ncbi:helix-turn-helix transcriptional regulator [Streptomyces globisporus]|uniref:helix-turn-helix domain-containing protein n=1 Tax=Streptomyces globisporus TaxID=1908 RepID=UPI0004CC5C36|nr:helix-turn-helix transcriptional regulator [Streptomyces globisporus]
MADALVAHAREKTQPIEAILLIQDSLDRLQSDLELAFFQQAFDRQMTKPQIAKALNMTETTVARLKSDHVERALKRTAAPPPQQVKIPAPRAPESPSPRTPTPEGGAPGILSTPAAPTTTPAATLSKALSQIQRESKKTFAALGDQAGVSRSYISRVLTGERTPSWKVTRAIAIAIACGADPGVLRPLWEATRGYHVVQPGSLHAALRGMQLAAGNLAPAEVSAHTGNSLSQDEITGILHGTRTPDWTTISTLVTALNGQPEVIQPLWHAAQPRLALPTTATPGLPTPTPTISAGSLG